MASTTPLSTKDTHILSLLSLPHPLLPPAAPPISNSTPTSSNSTPTSDPTTPLPLTEASILLPLNHPSPSPTALTTAITHLSHLITLHPTHAPTYNNRAQALRLLHGSDLFSPPVAHSTIWADLSTAIALSTPPSPKTTSEAGTSGAGTKAPEQHRKTLASAHTQRAWLVYKAAAKYEGAGEGMLPQELKGLGREGLEEWARGEFEKGAGCGNGVAGGMARGLNPVRKLCERIVGEMMRGEMGGREREREVVGGRGRR